MEKGFSDRQQRILVQIQEWIPKEYFVYFEGYILQSWGKRLAVLPEIVFIVTDKNYRLISSFSLAAREASTFLIILSSRSCRSFSAFFWSSSVISEFFFSFLT